MRNRILTIVATPTTSMFAVIVLQVFLVGPASSADPPLERIEELNSLETDVETPHTKWAKPWAGGPIRVLFLAELNANINGLPLRPAVELMQRFDLDADAVLVMPAKGNTYAIMFPGESGVYGGEAGEQRLARLLKKPYDCYVVTGSIMGHIPDSSRKLVMKRVQEGAGLVLFYKPGDEDAPLLEGSAQIDEQPEMLRDLDTDVRQLGRGRMVTHVPQNWSIYDRRPAEVFGLAHIFGTDLPRDLRFEKQGRVILWAAGREPELDLSLTVPAKSLDRGEIPNHSIRVSWKGKRLTRRMRLAIRIRSQSRGSQELPIARDFDPAAGDESFALPALPAGRYFVDGIARSDRGVEAWKVKDLTITSAPWPGD